MKTASEVIRRHEQQLQAQLHKEIEVEHGDARILVTLDITPDEDNPTARLAAADENGDELGSVTLSANFKLNRTSALAFISSGYAKPRS